MYNILTLESQFLILGFILGMVIYTCICKFMQTYLISFFPNINFCLKLKYNKSPNNALRVRVDDLFLAFKFTVNHPSREVSWCTNKSKENISRLTTASLVLSGHIKVESLVLFPLDVILFWLNLFRSALCKPLASIILFSVKNHLHSRRTQLTINRLQYRTS